MAKLIPAAAFVTPAATAPGPQARAAESAAEAQGRAAAAAATPIRRAIPPSAISAAASTSI
ncbi:hypothetical protein ACFSLT_27470 [Novosphingobium resinovorum]